MALSFNKKAPGTKPAATTPAAKTPASKNGASNGASKPLGWMKRGAAAQQAAAQEEARIELAKSQGGMYRFWMPEDSERRITFLDGELDAEGVLDVLAYYEHNLKIAGRFEPFVCTAEADPSQPCPICAAGEKASLVHVLTVIDHNPYQIKSGANAGKVIKNSRKLFVAKRNTMALLTKQAVKRSGLAGATFDVTRIGEKSAGVGSQFEFVEKHDSGEALATQYGLDAEGVAPADYEVEIRYLSPEELIELGVGKKPGGVGYENGVGGLKDAL